MRWLEFVFDQEFRHLNQIKLFLFFFWIPFRAFALLFFDPFDLSKSEVAMEFGKSFFAGRISSLSVGIGYSYQYHAGLLTSSSFSWTFGHVLLIHEETGLILKENKVSGGGFLLFSSFTGSGSYA